jgi:hypothetical protein
MGVMPAAGEPGCMHRRQVLHLGSVAFPLAISGCTSAGGNDGDTDTPAPSPADSPTPTVSPSPTPTPAGTPVEVVSTDDGPDVSIEYDAAMAEPLATGEHPARLRVTIRNRADQEVVLGEERAVQFHHVTSEDGTLYLLPDGSSPDEFADPGCWRLTDRVAVPEYYGTIAVPAGESVVAESHVMGSADLPDGACLPSGEHRVTTSGMVAPSADDVLEDTGDATEFEWGLTLRIG